MTLIPFQNHSEIKAAEGVAYKVEAYCAHPECGKFSDHAHHVVRRSFIGGDVAWVEYKSHKIQNIVPLCWGHHEEITQNKAFLFWHEDTLSFWWYDQQDEEPAKQVGPLSYAAMEEHVGPASKRKCPACGRPAKKEPEEKTEETRQRRTWAITVPNDERENGAETLDTLMQECRDLFGHDESKRVRFFTLTQALALVVQNGHKLMADA